MDERTQARETLTRIREHQERTRRAASVPWWMYVAMFVLTAGCTAINDFVDRGGGKLLAVVVLILLVLVLAVTFASRSAPLSRIRGVQRRQTFEPRIFGAILLVVAAGAWLVPRYGTALVRDLAGALGLTDYPNTVAGVVFGAALTALFGIEQFLVTVAERRRDR